MHAYLATAAGNCNTGSWSQRWNCGWNQPATAASGAGYTVGHDILPWLIVVVVVLLFVKARRSRSGARSGPAKAARR